MPSELMGFLSRQFQPSPVRNPFAGSQFEDLAPTEEDLIQEQEEMGMEGAESGRPFAVPSREQLGESAYGKIRQFFGKAGREAELKALPTRIAGEYNLAATRESARGREAAARAQADRAMAIEEMRRQTAQEAEQGRNARAAAVESGRQIRSQNIEAGRGSRAKAGELFKQAGAVQKQPVGLFDRVKNLFGMGGPTPQEQAEALRQQGLEALTGDEDADAEIQAVAQELMQEFPGRSLDELLQMSGPDGKPLIQGTPEEIEALRQYIR